MKELLFTMFKIGCIGFGGGTALVPVIESEVVYEKKLIDKDEYTKDVVVANITPGALPVEVAAGVGRKVCGIPGMLLSAVLMGLPGTFLTVLILMLINSSGERILQQILFASVGVTAYIIYMLLMYAKGTFRECREKGMAKSGTVFMFLVFLLTSGKDVFQLFGINRTPVFDIATIDVQDYPFNGDHSGILPVCGTNASDQQFKGAVWVAPYHDRAVNLWTVQRN